jgi:hypothetical protein
MKTIILTEPQFTFIKNALNAALIPTNIEKFVPPEGRGGDVNQSLAEALSFMDGKQWYSHPDRGEETKRALEVLGKPGIVYSEPDTHTYDGRSLRDFLATLIPLFLEHPNRGFSGSQADHGNDGFVFVSAYGRFDSKGNYIGDGDVGISVFEGDEEEWEEEYA